MSNPARALSANSSAAWGATARWLHGRDWVRNPLRTALTLGGVALGVAGWLSIQLVTGVSVDQFKAGIEQVAGKATLEVVPTTGDTLTEATVLPALRSLWAQQADWRPVLEGVAIWPNTPNEVIRLLGVDMATDPGERDIGWAQEGKPTDELAIFQARQVYLGQAMAQGYGLKVGQTFEVLINDHRETLQVAGILANKGLGGVSSGHLIVMDVGAAQSLLQKPGLLSRVELVTRPDQQTALTQTLVQRLPADVRVQPPARRGAQLQQMLSAYHINLTALSLIALMVGIYLIYNTLSMTVLRRRSEIGILRSLGMSRRQIITHYLAESAAYGLIGSLAGIGLGVALAQGFSGLVSSTLQVVYSGQPIGPLHFPGWLLVAGGLGGLVMSLIGGLVPALEAASVSPVSATRRNSQQSSWIIGTGWLALSGLIIIAVALWTGYRPATQGIPVFGYVASTLGIVGVSLMTPWLLWQTLPGLANLLGRFGGPSIRLGLLQLRGGLGRSAVAVAALAVSVGMVISLTVMIASFRATVQDWVRQTLRADLFVQPLSATYSRGGGLLSAETVARLRQVPGVIGVDDFLETSIELNGRPAKLGVGNFEVFRRFGQVRFTDGEPFETVTARLVRHPEQTIISEPLAVKLNLHKGDAVTLQTPTGPTRLVVANIYYDYASEQGYLLVDRSFFRRHYPPGTASNSVALYLQPGVSAEAARDSLLKTLPAASRLTIRTNRDLKAEVLRIFDQTFAITYAIQAIALGVSVLAVLNTLLALTWEQRSQLAMLRSLGATGRQMIRLVQGQALGLGLYGLGLGSLLGAGLAALLIFVVNRQAFGWTLSLAIPWGVLVSNGGALLGVAWLTGLWPSRQILAQPIARLINQATGR